MSQGLSKILIQSAGRVSLEKNADNLLQSAGRVLSQKNADSLLQSYLQIGKVLSIAGVLDLKSIEGLEELFSSEIETEELAAASLETDVKRVTWREKLRRTCGYFSQRFCQIYEIPDIEFAKKYDAGKTRKEAAEELLDDLNLLVKELMVSPPGALNDPEERYGLPYMSEYMGMSGKTQETEELEVVFDCPAQKEALVVDVEAAANSNKFPIKGVLFRIDEASESAPSVGPNLPLYISLAVAQSIIPQIQGLPLDADDSLSKHANNQITGVLQAGEIDNNDFVVHGHLFPFNQAEKVEAITKAKDKLGMSMNAKATGAKSVVNGQQVFEVTSLELLGANILYSDKATYRKTKLIAASSEELTDSTEELMSKEVAEQLEKMYGTLLQMQSQQDAELASIKNSVQEVQLEVRQIQAEKENIELAAQSQNLAQQQQQEREQFISQVGDIIDQKLKQFRNPTGQPPRITTPLAASSSGSSDPLSPLQQQLVLAEARLDGMRQSNGSRATRIAAAQEVSTLKQQLGIH